MVWPIIIRIILFSVVTIFIYRSELTRHFQCKNFGNKYMSKMYKFWFCILMLSEFKCKVVSWSATDEFPWTGPSNSEDSSKKGTESESFGIFNSCQERLKSGELINLNPLSRTDGIARFFKTGQVWNYTFDPCSTYNEPKDPHTGFGDGCSSVLMCVFGLDEKSYHYYTLGIQRTARIRVKYKDENTTAIQLVLKGTKSMRNRLTFINLICDRSLVTVQEARFEITNYIGKGPVEGNLHHVCCCPDGCLVKSLNTTLNNSTDMESEESKPDKTMLLIVVCTNLGLLFIAALIGGLCYIKRTHLQIYYKLPGLHPHDSRGPEKSVNKQTGSISRPSPYSDWEPSGPVKKKLFPVLEESEVLLNSLDMSQRLGGGLFGDTHIAKWNGMNVAVKRLTLNVHQNQVTQKTMEYMKEEVWKLSRLRNKLIVTVIGLCLDGRMPYIITEYVEGECLRDFIKIKGHQLTWPQRIKICTQIADGIAFLHSCKPIIIHRDVRCGNLFIIDEDVIKVADFGLTKLIQPMREECTQDDCCCMREYSACPAILRWTAPEILANPTAHEDSESLFTSACDVYSLGMVMCEIIMGEDPFDDLNTEQEIIEFVLAGGRPDLSVTPDLLVQYKDLITECWRQQPKLRPSSKQVAVKLKEMMQHARTFQKSFKNKHLQKSQQIASV